MAAESRLAPIRLFRGALARALPGPEWHEDVARKAHPAALRRGLRQEQKQRMMRLDFLPSALAVRTFGGRFARSDFLRHTLRAAVVAMAIAAVGIVIAILAILLGPTEFGAVRARIENILTANLGEAYDVSVGRALIDVDPVYGLVVQVDNVTIRDDRGAVVANVPSTRWDPLESTCRHASLSIL